MPAKEATAIDKAPQKDGDAPAPKKGPKGDAAAKKQVRVDNIPKFSPENLPAVPPPRRERPDNELFQRQFQELIALKDQKRKELVAHEAPKTPEQLKLAELEAQRTTLNGQINKLTEQINVFTDEKKLLQPVLQEARSKVKDNLELLKSQNRNMGFKSVREIDAEIMRIEVQHQTGGKSGRDAEKSASKRISELKAARAGFDELESLDKFQSALRDESKSVQENVASLSEKIALVLPQRAELFKERDALKVELDAAYTAARASRKETENPAKKELAQLDERIDSLKAFNQRAWTEFKTYQAYDKALWLKNKAERDAERKQRDAERKARQAAWEAKKAAEVAEKEEAASKAKAEARKLRLNPCTIEAEQCDMLIKFFNTKRWYAGNDTKTKTATQLTLKSEKAPVQQQKKVDDDELFGETRVERKTKQSKPQAVRVGASAKQKLSVPPDVLDACKKTGVTVPKSFDEIDTAIAKAEERKTHFLGQKRTEAELDEEDRIANEKAAKKEAAAKAAAAEEAAKDGAAKDKAATPAAEDKEDELPPGVKSTA